MRLGFSASSCDHAVTKSSRHCSFQFVDWDVISRQAANSIGLSLGAALILYVNQSKDPPAMHPGDSYCVVDCGEQSLC